MNIFFLHRNPKISARWHVDRHVTKMILEICQMWFTSWHMIDPTHAILTPAYMKTHVNHPCAKWVRQSTVHYDWLVALGQALCMEYTFR